MNTDSTLNLEYQIVNIDKNLIFQMSTCQWRILIEKITKWGGWGEGGACLPDPQLDNFIYYSNKLSKI